MILDNNTKVKVWYHFSSSLLSEVFSLDFSKSVKENINNIKIYGFQHYNPILTKIQIENRVPSVKEVEKRIEKGLKIEEAMKDIEEKTIIKYIIQKFSVEKNNLFFFEEKTQKRYVASLKLPVMYLFPFDKLSKPLQSFDYAILEKNVREVKNI